MVKAVFRPGGSELRDPVDRQEHVEFAFGEPQLADIDVNIANHRVCEPISFGGILLTFRQPRDAMPLQASAEAAARRWPAGR